ncbi:unnamed protein product [Clonostachys rhizophaga]|uniref:Uncharacterized protein n=1 Tax=Clonostachys rhizophaga TaxID=160324 RepID=A0A9N9Z9P2_9HYPO|nr:unnamed protein product [Clonostachys rhizophaga]
MTRPKVPEERRQRIAQACDTCKRRKQKLPPSQYADGFKSHPNRLETPGQHHGRVITRVFSPFEAPLVQPYWDLAVAMTQYPRIQPQNKIRDQNKA